MSLFTERLCGNIHAINNMHDLQAVNCGYGQLHWFNPMQQLSNERYWQLCIGKILMEQDSKQAYPCIACHDWEHFEDKVD